MLVRALFERWFVYHVAHKQSRLICLVLSIVPYVTCIACNMLTPEILSPLSIPRQKTV